MSKISKRTFFITGISSGFGSALAQAALDQAHTVIGTVRNAAAKVAFEAKSPNAHAICWM